MVRKRHRYVTVEVHKPDGWSAAAHTRSHLLTQTLISSIRTNYGVHGVALAKTGLFIEFLGPDALLARVTMRRSAYRIVMSSLQFVTVVDGSKVSIATLHTAATIRHANLFVTRYLRNQIQQQLSTATLSQTERADLEQLLKVSEKKPRPVKDPGHTIKRLSLKSKKEKIEQLQNLLSSS